MRSRTKWAAFAGVALIMQSGLAFADSTAPAGPAKPIYPPCPKGMVDAPDGTCVKAKSGRMGFDLAAPSDDNAGSSTHSGGNGRSVTSKGHGHH